MKNVKKALAAAVISVACGSAMASSVQSINVYDGMEVVDSLFTISSTGNNPNYYELNVTDANGAQVYLSLLDTTDDFHSVTYDVTSDLNSVVGEIGLGGMSVLSDVITDKNLPGVEGTLAVFLAAGQYVLMLTGSAGSQFSQSQVSAVPLPAAAWLFGSALIGMGVFRRRKQADLAAV